MRQLTTLFIIFLLTSCSNNESTKFNILISETDSLRSILTSIYNGNWVQANYVYDIVKTNSPYKSRDKLSAIVELNINAKDANRETFEVGAPSIHEGTSFQLFLKKGITTNAFVIDLKDYDNKTNFFELGYEIDNRDTCLLIYHFSKTNKLLDKEKYIKSSNNVGEGLQFVVNKKLIAGTYNLTDSSGQKSIVKFTENGNISGVPGVTTYYILTDFVAGPENNLDQMCFDIQTKNQKCYGFQITGNTVSLYELTEDEDHLNLNPSKLKYRFVRQ